MTRARTVRRWWLATLVVVLGLVGTGCDTGIDGIDDGGSGPSTKPVTLIVSQTWVNDHQGGTGTGEAAGGSDVQARLTTLQKASRRLLKLKHVRPLLAKTVRMIHHRRKSVPYVAGGSVVSGSGSVSLR